MQFIIAYMPNPQHHKTAMYDFTAKQHLDTAEAYACSQETKFRAELCQYNPWKTHHITACFYFKCLVVLHGFKALVS